MTETKAKHFPLLETLGTKPGDESLDYVQNKSQFHLHNLLTGLRYVKSSALNVAWHGRATSQENLEPE